MANTSVYIPSLDKSITLDNSQFDIKFNRLIEQLEAGLSRVQKVLGLFYNDNQQLSDAMGRCVEGLSN